MDKSPHEVKAYFEQMTKGPNRIVEKSTIAPEADALSLLYNDSQTAVAYGHSNDHYKLTDGTEFDQNTRWSATLVKKDGQWKVASVHISDEHVRQSGAQPCGQDNGALGGRYRRAWWE